MSNAMVDIHAHIIPGIDDGAADESEALLMAEAAVESGVEILTATPHSNSAEFPNLFGRGLYSAFRELKKAVDENLIPLNLCFGMEIMASADMVQKLKAGQLVTLNRSRYPLIEFPFDAGFQSVRAALDGLIKAGYTPVVAHPERYYCIQREPSNAETLRDDGCLLQLNKGSVSGGFGEDSRKCAFELLRGGLINVVASDAHSSEMRTTSMYGIQQTLTELIGMSGASLLLGENPIKILSDERII